MDPKTTNPQPRGLSTFGGGFDPFSMLREMDRMFEGVPRAWPAAGITSAGFLTPKVNIAETEAGLEVTAEFPGIDPKDIDVDVTDGVLTLKAERKSEREEKDEKKQYHLVERSYGTFLRRFALPFDVDVAKVDASFDKGVLKILAPRSKDAKKQSKIEIKSS
jgi:HSP20 family protein